MCCHNAQSFSNSESPTEDMKPFPSEVQAIKRTVHVIISSVLHAQMALCYLQGYT